MIEEKRRQLVLVIEDEDNIATALEYVIEREGYAYARIAEGSGALKAIRTMQPSIVLLDVMLPNVSGFDICRSVREDDTLNSIRIVIMTARGSASQQAHSKTVGADAFLPKPFDLSQVREIIKLQSASVLENSQHDHKRLT